MVETTKDYGASVDVFSLGLVMASLLTLRPIGEPYSAAADTLLDGEDGPPSPPPPLKPICVRGPQQCFEVHYAEIKAAALPGHPPALIDLCLECCESDPGKRPSAEDVSLELEDLLTTLSSQDGTCPTPQPKPSTALEGALPVLRRLLRNWRSRRVKEAADRAAGRRNADGASRNGGLADNRVPSKPPKVVAAPPLTRRAFCRPSLTTAMLLEPVSAATAEVLEVGVEDQGSPPSPPLLDQRPGYDEGGPSHPPPPLPPQLLTRAAASSDRGPLGPPPPLPSQSPPRSRTSSSGVVGRPPRSRKPLFSSSLKSEAHRRRVASFPRNQTARMASKPPSVMRSKSKSPVRSRLLQAEKGAHVRSKVPLTRSTVPQPTVRQRGSAAAEQTKARQLRTETVPQIASNGKGVGPQTRPAKSLKGTALPQKPPAVSPLRSRLAVGAGPRPAPGPKLFPRRKFDKL